MDECENGDKDVQIVTKHKSEFQNLYKCSGRKMSSQEERRRLLLEKQKEKRNQGFDEKRDLSELFDNASELMECENVIVKKKYQRKCPLKYRLMNAEWFTEVPEDLSDNWLMKICPEGSRYLVVADRGRTVCYRQGRSVFAFKSNLPGGGSSQPGRFTVLDCIYNKSTNTYFAFDCLAWASMLLVKVEASFRFLWLKSKFNEEPSLSETEDPGHPNFVLMDFFPAKPDILQEIMSMPFTGDYEKVGVEGVLFYHKEGFYNFGLTPLVGWLKSFMLTEMFNVDVPSLHLQKKPENYESVQQYIDNIASKKKTKRRSISVNSVCMEMEELENGVTECIDDED